MKRNAIKFLAWQLTIATVFALAAVWIFTFPIAGGR
jgi:hypothetical protein